MEEVAREEEQADHCSVDEKNAKGPGLERFPSWAKVCQGASIVWNVKAQFIQLTPNQIMDGLKGDEYKIEG